MRVLRRFLNSVLSFAALSATIPIASSAKLPPASFMQTPPSLSIFRFHASEWHQQLLRHSTLRSTFRGRPSVCSCQKHPCFFCNPDWPNQQVNRSLEKRRMVSLDPVAEKEKHPSTQKKSRSQDPFCEEQKDNPGKNHRDANAMEEFVPAGFLLVIVLRHVVRQARHLAHPLSAWDRLPKLATYPPTVTPK